MAPTDKSPSATAPPLGTWIEYFWANHWRRGQSGARWCVGMAWPSLAQFGLACTLFGVHGCMRSGTGSPATGSLGSSCRVLYDSAIRTHQDGGAATVLELLRQSIPRGLGSELDGEAVGCSIGLDDLQVLAASCGAQSCLLLVNSDSRWQLTDAQRQQGVCIHGPIGGESHEFTTFFNNIVWFPAKMARQPEPRSASTVFCWRVARNVEG